MPATTIPIYVPFGYVAALITALYLFSRTYRKRSAERIARLEPWFPSHPERDTYITLLQLSPPPSDVLLKAALLRRAVTDVQRILSFREDKTALQQLLQKGSISDDLWNAFTAAEKELEAEIVEVVNEANSYRDGWGQFIFQSASEVVNNLKQRELVLNMPKMKAEAEAKYGTKKTATVKAVASGPVEPSPQTSATSSPKPNPLLFPSQPARSPSPLVQGSETAGSDGGETLVNGTPSKSQNGVSPASSTSMSPKSQNASLRGKKRK